MGCWHAAAWLAVLLLATATAQPLSAQLQATAPPAVKYPLYNYTLNNQTLFTACRCMDMWTYTLANGSVAQFSGCANPNNDPAGPFCKVNTTTTRCPAGETLSMSNGKSKFLVVPCLPQRVRTLAGCLCSNYWTERNDIDLSQSHSWPILPTAQMQDGLHQGWLLAGNCSRALDLPGGARCLVVEGTCSSMPANAYPPPAPNIFWQITSQDPQGWDFCADPAYDQERAAQGTSSAAVLAALPANLRPTVKMTTQAGCECSPLNWTYYPSIIQDASMGFMTYLGCANPDNDPHGDWCVVDPRTCPSYYGAKQPNPEDVPKQFMNRYYFDYCGPVRNKTEAGCLCMGNWKPTFNSSLESAPGNPDVPENSRITLYSGGVCGNPPELQRARSWCWVDYRTCQSQPAGRATTGPAQDELWFDLCPGPPAQPTKAATNAAVVVPANAAYLAEGAGPASPSPAGPPPPGSQTGGLYLPPGTTNTSSPGTVVSPGLYLPGTPQSAAPVPLPGPAVTPATPGPVPPTTNTNGNGSASPVSVAAVPPPLPAPSSGQAGPSSSKQVPVAAIVVPIVVGVVVIAAVVAGLLWHRRRKRRMKQTALDWAASQTFPGAPPPDPGVGGRYPSVKYPNAPDVENGAGGRGPPYGSDARAYPPDQMCGKASGIELHSKMGPGQHATHTGAPDGSGRIDAAPMASAGTSFFTASNSHSYMGSDTSSSMYGSQVPLMGCRADAASSKDAKAYIVAHDSPGSSSSGLPSARGGHTPAAVARRNDAAAAAAAEAEKRAASLASMWECGAQGHGMGRPPPVGVHYVGGTPLAPMHEEEHYLQHFKQQQQQQQQQQLDAAGPKDQQKKPVFARILSSPFAAGLGFLPSLASTEPSAAYPPPTGPVGPAALYQRAPQPRDLHRVDDLSKPLTDALASEQRQREGALQVVTQGNTPVGESQVSRPPTTPLNQEPSRASAGFGSGSSSNSGSKAVSWVLGSSSCTATTARASPGAYDPDGDTQLSGLTGMSWGGTEQHGRSVGARSARSSSPSDSSGLAMVASIAPPATRHLSGPGMDQNWDFQKCLTKPVRVLLQVSEDDYQKPVVLLLLVSAPPPRPEVLAQIVLPTDKPIAGVNMHIDADKELCFPSNSFLGQGAFGQVHRALYKSRHPVAVKMLTDPDLRSADPETLRSFKEELGVMVRLEHPNIVKCYGGNLEGSNPFIVTELCECSLNKMINHYKRKWGTGLPLRHSLVIGLQIASALWHMHPSVVHRDLKPQNVLLDSAGTAKVTDFGLSRIKTHTFVSTQHVEAGTASYMAPECFGNCGVSEKVDVYSLAMLLLECVEGVRPWKGHNMVQVAFQVAMKNNRPALPKPDPAHCPAELLQLIVDCWATNPKERPSSGEVMKRLAQMIRLYVPDDQS